MFPARAGQASFPHVRDWLAHVGGYVACFRLPNGIPFYIYYFLFTI